MQMKNEFDVGAVDAKDNILLSLIHISYWVYDTDGWAYWAQAIEPDTSTGLLLNGLNQLSMPDDDWHYAINVVGQFASLGDWGTEEGNDGFFGDEAGAKPTDNARCV